MSRPRPARDSARTERRKAKPSLQGGEAASRLAHNQEIACASQAPATTFRDEPAAAADTAGDYLREPAAAVSGQIIREGDAPRKASAASGEARKSANPDTEFSEESRERQTAGTPVSKPEASPMDEPREGPSGTAALTWDQMDGDTRRAVCLEGRKAGLSATKIAEQYRASRNAVIGYLHRLGKAGVVVPQSPYGAGRKKVAAPKLPTTAQGEKPKMPAAKPSRPIHGAGVASAIRARLVPAENRPALPPERVLVGAPAPRNLSIMDLTNEVCRYPIGDPKLPSFGFCGASTEGRPPYCSYHHRVVYVPASERRRADRIATGTMKKAA